MNKLVLHAKNEDKRVITFLVNKSLRDQLTEILRNSDKYTLKQKSEWINEAIVMLHENPSYKEMVLNAEGSNKEFVLDKVKMTFGQRCIFSTIRNEVVVAHPDIRGPQGAIIRAAIVSRMVRGL